MAREKKLALGAINITIQPHTPQKYLEMFRDVYKLKRPAQISGNQFGFLSHMGPLDRDQQEPGPITGDIVKYTDIDPNAPWWNAETNEFAKEEELDSVQIPEHLKPNSSRFSYIFFPEEHLFFYEAYYDGKPLGPQTAERFVEHLLNVEEIIEKYGKVDVTHVPDVDVLSEALRLPFKETIEMEIKRPNPDFFAKAEKRVMERMNAQNVEVYEQKYKALKGKSIDMDNDTEVMATIAAKNGNLVVKGKDANLKPKTVSTKKHPFTDTEYYDPALTVPFDVFSRLAVSWKGTIVDWFRR